ncbi:PadR family transcriptional regulator [Acidaminobacter sp. JC074]|uniref:PadR family transcriptional regulator n=1 Tax=Acidaminobacter sp. JC074 TaxID=2530199 RepID=UPI001F0CDE84|nr:helix-turn-helix transcriptional regulator [Acidaminobacter sp. JC074]MCH4888056.1 PadR family transcriptional regulator [Acidaminobacter sp. JC074]
MARRQLQTLTEPMYYVLLCLKKPLHGYGIMQKIDEVTQGRVKVGPGTLYNLMDRFVKEDIVQRVETSGKKKTYQLTDKGYELLDAEIKRLKTLIADGEKMI